MTKFKKGDRVKFKRYEDWGEPMGIRKDVFEPNYSYDKYYEVTYSDDTVVSITPNPSMFVFNHSVFMHEEHDHFDDDLFNV